MIIHEKILKREDGSKVKIEVELYTGGVFDKNKFSYTPSISFLPYGKRKWVHYPIDPLKPENPFCTLEEILEVKIELWEKLKPTL